ncbi:hypothetical protein J4772_31815 [Cohnella sp. LGH]|uniref:hypothetical protein n=1 Tax=Cohnella sp. LGH TaxID=1619153 RepID=UPI001ADC2826|nr:hypothetical protein [Cohnella sp. LGH]QTH42045.1 hypothetical protein J4772_31815 [Cohnella sp. LGH]
MMEIIKKKTLLIILLLILTGCSTGVDNPENSTFTYEKFKSIFSEFKESFNPSPNYILVSPDNLVVKTTSFPNNRIDDRAADVINDSVEFPARYEVYYKSLTSDLLIKVNFIYMPTLSDNESTSFLTINSINDLDNTNIKEGYQDIDRPMMDEYYITVQKILITINFIDNSEDKIQEDRKEKLNEFIKQEVSFYELFEKELLKIINNK